MSAAKDGQPDVFREIEECNKAAAAYGAVALHHITRETPVSTPTLPTDTTGETLYTASTTDPLALTLIAAKNIAAKANAPYEYLFIDPDHLDTLVDAYRRYRHLIGAFVAYDFVATATLAADEQIYGPHLQLQPTGRRAHDLDDAAAFIEAVTGLDEPQIRAFIYAQWVDALQTNLPCIIEPMMHAMYGWALGATPHEYGQPSPLRNLPPPVRVPRRSDHA